MRPLEPIGEAAILRWDDVEFEEVNYYFLLERQNIAYETFLSFLRTKFTELGSQKGLVLVDLRFFMDKYSDHFYYSYFSVRNPNAKAMISFGIESTTVSQKECLEKQL